jgi:hypothetical protein
MKKDIDTTTIRRNLRSNTVKERYWKTKISVIGILLILMLLLCKLCKTNNFNISEKRITDMNSGEKIEDSLKKPNTKDVQPKDFKINASGSTVSDVYSDFKRKMAAKIQPGITYNFISLKKKPMPGQIEFVCDIQEIDNGFAGFSLVFNPIHQPQLSKQSVLQKNPGAKGLEDGVIDGFEYHLIGLK